ncbi:two-component sensor histidine kinase [Marinobacterium nitratireducens]|uniref:histidine kinase n=1 Tax=Marinobacterium nitratireducens TaxID=518897 RepID=A0A918DVA9_9GAMM|nr:ATP-binding protein [Marinobacterium nitratireducens]GGO85705.1 two-component sensor histidine kinase [Marinobacterium nitratireducens]
MQGLFRRLQRWPRSVSGRILLVLGLGVLLAQIVSSAIWLAQFRADNERNVREMSRHMAYRVASTVQFFTSLPTAYRHVVLDQLRDMGGTRFFVTLNREEIGINDLPDSPLKRIVVAQFREVLRQELGLDQRVRIAFSRPLDLHVIRNDILLTDLPDRWGKQALLVGDRQAPILVIQIPIGEAQWLYLATLMPDPGFLETGTPLSPERLLSLLVSLAVMMLFGVWIVRSLTRPLRRLAAAAESFGHGQPQPLSEAGSRELEATARAFNGMQLRIQRYLNDRERLFASISHDLKTPITRLRLRAEMLENDGEREAFCRDLEDLDMLVKGALQSVKDTDIHENRVEVDLHQLLCHLRDSARLGGQAVTLEGEQRAPFLGKPLALRRCLGNLIDNALFYGGGADVRIDDSPERLEIRVLDSGPGIPEDKLEQAFTPYTRLSTQHSGQAGMGLGLSIARNIARAHGGELQLRNRPEGGLEACLTLPRQS